MLRFRVALVAIPVLLFAGCGDEEPAASQPSSTPTGSAGSPPVVAGEGGSGAIEGERPSGGAGGSPNAGAPGGGPASGDAPAGEGPAGELPASDDTGPLVPAGPLPDLVLDAAYLIDTTIEDTVETDDQCLLNEGCVTGLGERRVVRFGTRTGNIGTADFLLGRPEADNPYWTYDACHDQYDLVGFAFYELLDAAGAVVLTGVKNGFCIRDSEPWELEGGPFCRSFDCNGQGIGQGCADNYGSELQCQWVDITGVPAGNYTLRVTINASRSMPELDYSNNVVLVDLEILDDSVRVVR